ncbi:MAG: alpha/beta hydrolase-fold protein [Brevinematales bacterium]|nr:alpha/beta hydrolase-fold protein [Brevinematales bacterium]
MGYKKRIGLIFASILVGTVGFAQSSQYIVHRNFPSRFVDPRNIVIYLPPDYFTSTHRYPVLYMHDGQNLFDNQKTGLRGAGSPIKWNVDQALEKLLSEHKVSPCIIVGIFNTAKRIEEYAPPTNSSERGLLGNYARFIVEELKPWIDTTYRTDPSPQATGVMGSSLGGLASFYLHMWYPDVFGFSGIVSPSFWWGKEYTLSRLTNFDLTKIGLMYIDAGWKESDEMMIPARNMYHALFPKLGDRLWYYEDRNGTHSESSWQSRVFLPLLLFLGKEKTHLLSWQAIIDPPSLGVGDTSSVTVEALYTENIRKTSFPLLSSQKLTISNFQITGRTPGEASLTIQSLYGTLTTNLIIQPKSRDAISIRFLSSRPVILEVFRYVTNNLIITTNFEINLVSSREVTLTQTRGSRFHFRLLDENRQIIEKNGKPLELSVTFTRDRDYLVEF